MNAKVTEIDAGHLALVTHAGTVAGVILQAAGYE
jgi:hypothetical protein